ncbi:sensor histidine kinase [Nonomuraea gerenzanensis]|uniref:Two-component system sensor kinase n=1 Tax=Nonomuraea gerenzanensis TaxID=93944 RepID=A0A1M4EAH1_9ACTN|nr:sensor histidine kinase [Nonomuraea gerenzanensis]UBU18120.1 sensor histidine kinase [Nonomuraea gerenzanensis]SBO95929.1 two-component system sensor kinase [Nonomuraea gerenzanensis]
MTLRRWDRVLAALPYLLVLLPALFSLLREWRVEVLALALFTAAWHWVVVARQPEWVARRWVVIGYFAVLLAAVAALVRIDTVFTVTGVGTFLQCFALLPGLWAYAGVAVTAGVLVAARPADGRTPVELLASFVVGVLIASMAGLVFQTVAEQNEQLKQTSARLAALAEENATLQSQLLDQAREAGVLGERQRMAREMHDTLAQGLTAILTQLEALGDVPGAGDRLATVRGLARESLAEARRSVHALRPAPLEESPGFAAALSEVAARWSRVSGVPAEVSVTGDARPLHAEVESTLLRVAQEALANVARHASAGRVVLTLSYMDDVVALDVRDDGAGFVHEPGRSRGFGLIGMRQRVIRLAGSFAIETAPGQGTGISATVPAIPAAAVRS